MYGDLGDWTTRFGVLGKSIYNIKDAISSIFNEVSSGNKNFGSALKDQLFPTKESIQDKLIPIDIQLPKVDKAQAQEILDLINDIETGVSAEYSSFQQLFDDTSKRQNQWIAKYAEATKGQIRSTDDVIAANKKARDSAIQYNNTLRQTTLGAKVTTLAIKGLALAGNILAGIAISAVVSGVFEMIQASSKVAEKASELGDQFDTTAESVEQYKKKIEELKATIADSGSSIEEVTNARQGLLDLQSEMIEKYGAEKSVIDTVTESINDQTSALDKLTDNAWRKAKNEFNDTSFWSGLSNFFQGYDTNVDRMIDEYGKHSAKINLNQYADFTKDGEQLDEFIRLAQSLGGKLTVSDAEGSFLEFNGVASDVENTLIRIQGIAENLQLSSKFQKHIGDLAKDAEDLADKYKTFYDQYILQEKVLSKSGEDNGYAEVYKNLLDQKKKIDEAYTSGDDAAREDAIKEYANILSAALEANGDNEVTQWLRSMYPDIQGEVSKWVFKLNFEANKDGLKDNLEEYIKTFTGKGYAAEDIIDYDPAKSNDVDLESAYRSINQALEGTGLELKDIIPLFEELNLVQSRAQQLLSKKFGKDQVAKLAPEDLEIVKGFSQDAIDSMESWDDLIKKIEEAKLAAQNAAAEISSARKLKDINADKSGIDGLFSKYENAEGQLSQDDVASILEANPEYIQYLIKVGDQYKLNKQALEDWNAVNKEQELAIDNQMGGNKYLESYDSVLSDIANPASHGNGDGVGGTGISEQLDDLIAKNKELNNSFLNGEITASEYFSNLSGYITSSGLEDALHSLNGEFDDTTDYIEETVSVLSTELSDALLQSNKRFLKGETSVSQYIDELQAGTNAQKKLLASTYNLQTNSSGMVEITDDMSESTKKAAESYNDLVNAQSDLEGASGLADTLRDNADFLTQYTDEAGNLMSSIFQDNQFDSYISSMSDKIAEFASTSIDNMSSTAEWLSQTAGISLQEATDIIGQGGNAIQDTVGNSLEGVGSMTSFAMQSVQGSISNASTAIGSVLTSLGDMISSFKYKIEATPYIKGKTSFKVDENGVDIQLPTFGFDINGSGGESVKQFTSALNNAGNYFTKAGTEQANAKVLDLDSYKNKNDSNTAGGYRPTYDPKKKKSGGGSGDKEPTEFDWIERKLDVVNEKIQTTQNNIEQLVGYKDKNAETDTALDLMTQKLEILQQMSDAYMKSANEIGLSEDYINRIKNGDDFVEEIGDKDIADKVKKYQDLYDKAQDCTKQISDLNKEIKETALSELDNIIDQYDQLNDVLSKPLDTQLQILDWHKASGTMEVVADDYIALGETQKQIAQNAREEYDRLAEKMKKLNLKEGSDEWKKYNDQLIQCKQNMVSAAQAVEDYKDQMKELVYKELTDYKSKMDSINNTISTMTDLIGDTKLVDETGKLTDRGLAQMALYAQQLANAKQEAAEYDDAIKSLADALDSGLITQDEYNDMLSDYRSSQESAVSATKDARDAIISLAKEGIQAEIDARKEQTDAAIEALDAEKDLHDYTESINEKQKNITTLQKKIAALSGAQDGAELAQRLKLENDLIEAQKDLYNTQYDHNREEQKKMLNDAYDAYEKEKNDEMDELDSNLAAQEKAINKYLSEVKANYKTAYKVLNQYGDEYNLSATEDLTTPWESGSSAANLCADAIGDAVANINYEISNIDISPLEELISAMQQLADYGISGSGDRTQSFKDVTGEGKWHKGSGGRYWYGNSNEDYVSGGIYTIEGQQYGFGDDGYMFEGWNNEYDGNWRYFQKKDGYMVKSDWVQDKGKWYYLDKNGAMLTDSVVKDKNDSNKYYYVDDNGVYDGKELTYDQVKAMGLKVGYRKGTKSADKGWHAEGEDGYELIEADDGTMLRNYHGGETVFTKAMTDNLWNFSKNPNMFVDDLKSSLATDVPMINNSMAQNININIPIAGNADMNTVNAIKEMLPKEMKKYATGPMFRDIQKAGRGYR